MVAAHLQIGQLQGVGAPVADGSGVDHLHRAVARAQVAQLGHVGAQIADGSGGGNAEGGFAAGQHLGAAAQSGNSAGAAGEVDRAIGLQPAHVDVARCGQAQVAAGGAQVSQGDALAAAIGAALDLQAQVALAEQLGRQAGRAQAGEGSGAVGPQGEDAGHHGGRCDEVVAADRVGELIQPATGRDRHLGAVNRAQVDGADADPAVIDGGVRRRCGGVAIDQPSGQGGAEADRPCCSAGSAGDHLAGDHGAIGAQADAAAAAAQAVDVDAGAGLQIDAAAAAHLQLGCLEAEAAAAIGQAIDRACSCDHQAVGADVVGGAVVGRINTACGRAQGQAGGGLQLAVGQVDVTTAAAGTEADGARDAGGAAGNQGAAGTGADRTAPITALALGYASRGGDAGGSDLAIELLMATGGQGQAATDRQVGGVVEADVAAAGQADAATGVQFADRLLHGARDRLAADAQISAGAQACPARDGGLADQLQALARADVEAAGLHNRVAKGRKAGWCLARQQHRAIHRHGLEHRLVLVERHGLATDHRRARLHLAELQAGIKDVTGIGHPLVVEGGAAVAERLGDTGPGPILGREGFLAVDRRPGATGGEDELAVSECGERPIKPSAIPGATAAARIGVDSDHLFADTPIVVGLV